MRIGILSQWYDPEPASAAVPGVLARGLRARGHKVRVLTGFPNYPTGKLADGYRLRSHLVEHRDGIEVHRVALYPSHDENAWRRAANYTSFAATATGYAFRLLRDVDVLWVHYTPATVSFPALVLRVIGGVPFIVHIQDLWPETVLDSGFIKSSRAQAVLERGIHAWCDRTYRLASSIAVISPGMKRVLADRSVSEGKIHVVPNWADEDLFVPRPYDFALARELGFVGRFTLMYAGSLGKPQALEAAVRAAALLDDVPSFQLVFVGSGTEESRLRSLADDLDLGDRVKFFRPRPVAEMPALLRAADAQLISLRDRDLSAITTPSKVQAALAAGRPIVAAVRGDAAELVESAGAGLSCAPESPEALAAVIRKLAELPASDREALGRSGQRYYRSHLAVDRAVDRLVRLLADATAGTARHSPSAIGKLDR